MKTANIFGSLHCVAQQGGFMPTYWSANALSNKSDRTPEITSGSREGDKIPRV